MTTFSVVESGVVFSFFPFFFFLTTFQQFEVCHSLKAENREAERIKFMIRWYKYHEGAAH